MKLTTNISVFSDGTQAHHWAISDAGEAELSAVEAALAEEAPDAVADAECVHNPGGFAAYHRLRAFRTARNRRFPPAPPAPAGPAGPCKCVE